MTAATATGYKFNVSLMSAQGHKFEIDTAALYGHWEHRVGGEGGGLWFERGDDGVVSLVDFDGAGTLPQSIVDKLRSKGYAVGESFDSETLRAARQEALANVEGHLGNLAMPGYQEVVSALRTLATTFSGTASFSELSEARALLARLPA